MTSRFCFVFILFVFETDCHHFDDFTNNKLQNGIENKMKCFQLKNRFIFPFSAIDRIMFERGSGSICDYI